MALVRHRFTLCTSLSATCSKGRTQWISFTVGSVGSGARLTPLRLPTALLMLLSYSPAPSLVPVAVMRLVVCMSSSCAFASSLSRPGPSCCTLHLPTLYQRLLPMFALRRLAFGPPSQGGGSTPTALAASRFPPSPPATSSAPARPPPAATDSSRPPPRPKRNVTCYYCGILGHVERECKRKQRGLPRVTVPGAPPQAAQTSAPPLLPMPFSPQAHTV